MQVGVLGPTVARRADAPVRLGGPLPRRLLTVLLAADGAGLSTEALIEALWDGSPPHEPVSSVRAYLSRLRVALGGAPNHPVIAQRAGGYVARLAEGLCDTDQTERLLAAAATERDPGRVTELASRALRLFRGRPFDDAGDGFAVEIVAPPRAFWAERLAGAVELHAAASIASGQPAVSVPELRRYLQIDALRERSWVLLAIALADSGERAGALAAVRTAQRVLAAELGVRPGRLLSELALALEDRGEFGVDRVRAEVLGPLAAGPGVRAASLRSGTTRWDGFAPDATLPAVGDAFVGRCAELALLDELTASHWVTTVTGPGGVGKTRLVMEWARGRLGGGPLWFTPLASRRGRNAVALALCATARLEGIFDNAVEAALRWATDRAGVLILDNCEHVLPEVRTLLTDLHRVAPDLVVVTTSRHSLEVAGEAVVGLDGLPLDQDSDAAEVPGNRSSDCPGPAVQLLIDRIRARRPGWHPSSADAPDLRRLAASLDGLPLALELTAVRSRAQSITELADDVRGIVAGESGIPAGSPSPHVTLAAAIDWSIDLLPAEQEALLVRLTPFAGGFTAEAASSVWGRDALPSLIEMVGRSVVRADVRQTPTRFSLLETIRMRCAVRDTNAAARHAHAEWVLGLGRRWFESSQDDRSSGMAHVLQAELPNIRAALAHDSEQAPVRAIMTLAGLDCWWYRGCLGDELMWWTQRLRQSANLVAPALRVRLALLHVVGLIMIRRDAAARQELAAVKPLVAALSRDDEDADYCRLLYIYLGTVLALQAGDAPLARTLAVHGAESARNSGHWEWFDPAHGVVVAGLDLAAGEVSGAFTEAERCLARSESMGTRWGMAAAGRVLAMALLARGEAKAALAAARTALRRNIEDLDVSSGAMATMVVARCLAGTGDIEAAATLAEGVRSWARRTGARWELLDGGILAEIESVLDGRLDLRRQATARRVEWSLADLQQLALG